MLKPIGVAPVKFSLSLVIEGFKPQIETTDLALKAKFAGSTTRTSLKASTLDGIFATVFTCIIGEVLLSNFLLGLGATSTQIGFLLAIPMLANFLQPLGAYLADQTTSRRWHGLRVVSMARLLWLLLALRIISFDPSGGDTNQLIGLTMLVVLGSHLLNALGTASWLSWMTVLVPTRLRGRYFGLRNGAANLTNLVCIPLLGMIVSSDRGGSVQAYGWILSGAVLAGLISLLCQLFMKDVNPQAGQAETGDSDLKQVSSTSALANLLEDKNFLKFLLFCGLWMFAVNLSAPFVNVYLLKDIGLDISRVTLYSSITAAANVCILMIWGRLADRIGHHGVLIIAALLVAIVPLLWLVVNADWAWLWLSLPLLYLLTGVTWSAVELCNNNLQMAIAQSQSSAYFAIAAAISGLGGALGASTGGILAELPYGIPGLFALSALLRLVALVPLLLVQEPGRQSFSELLRGLCLGKLLPSKVNLG